jgi:hypothetical protein
MDQRVRFLICGAQKAGTTALADQLRRHPELCVPEQKELHFFDDESVDWSSPDYEDYHRNFKDSLPGQQWGEATPIYMYWTMAPARIWRYNSEMRLIVILRNPITRAYSHWMMERNRGAETLNFDQAIATEAVRCRTARPQQHRVFSYQDRGFYSEQLRRLWHLFGENAVLILRQEDLRQFPQSCMNEICDHLAISRIPADEQLESHVGQYETAMSADSHAALREVFWHEVSQLESLLGWDCSDWLKPLEG